MASNAPFLITLSQHKEWMFAGTVLLLALAGWALYRPGKACPTDPELAALYARAHKWNIQFYWGSVIIWYIGFVTAYLLPLLY